MFQLDISSLMVGGLIGVSLFLFVLLFAARNWEREKKRRRDTSKKSWNLSPWGLARKSFGRAGVNLSTMHLFLLHAGSFLVSFCLLQIFGFLLPTEYDVPTVLLLTIGIPILAGYFTSTWIRIKFREGLIQWMYEAATESEVERNLFRLTEKLAETLSDKHARKELQIIIQIAKAETKPLVDVMMERAELWNLRTYKQIAVFTEVLSESGGNVREAYMSIRDSLERQKLRELKIKKKTLANRIGSFVIIAIFMLGLIGGYSFLQPIMANSILYQIWYYALIIDCLGVFTWLLIYTRRVPK